jgi:virginiamycin B lyase
MRRSAGLAASLFLTALTLGGCGHGAVIGSGPLPTPSPVPIQVLNNFTVPTAGSQPSGITSAPDGFLYFTEQTPSAGNIGRLSTGGSFTEFNIASKGGTTGNFAVSITAGPNGNLWFTERGTAPGVGTMPLSGTAVTEYHIAGSAPAFITKGPVINTLVFTDPGHNAVGQITTTGTVTETTLTTANANPQGIAVLAGDTNHAYVVEHDASKIAVFDAVANAITAEVATTTPNAGPTTAVQGPDGALWFTENNAAQLGRMTTSRNITEYSLAPAKSATGLVVGLDNNLYFADPVQNKFGQFNPITKKVVEFNISPANATPSVMTLGPDNLIYVTEPGANKIGQINY